MENKKANVLHCIYSFTLGGAEKLLIYFLKECKEEVTVVIMGSNVDEHLRQEILKTGKNIYFFNKKRGQKRFKYLLRILKIIKEKNINVIHSHDFGTMLWSILCKILKPKMKLVHTIHDSIYVKNWNKFTLFINRTLIDMNISMSDDILNDCEKNKLKTIKIYNGVDTKKFKPTQGNVNNFSIINVARITHYKKGQDILINALKKCKDSGMKFICNLVGPLEYDKESVVYLKRLINELDLSDEIKFLGNREDIPELLAQSDLFILPSRFEGLPVSLLEAMAAKLPIIASNITGSAELVKHENNGLLFEKENHSDLSEKILFLYNNRDELKRFAQNGYEFVQGFEISKM